MIGVLEIPHMLRGTWMFDPQRLALVGKWSQRTCVRLASLAGHPITPYELHEVSPILMGSSLDSLGSCLGVCFEDGWWMF